MFLCHLLYHVWSLKVETPSLGNGFQEGSVSSSFKVTSSTDVVEDCCGCESHGHDDVGIELHGAFQIQTREVVRREHKRQSRCLAAVFNGCTRVFGSKVRSLPAHPAFLVTNAQ